MGEEEPIKNYMARDVIKFDYPPLELRHYRRIWNRSLVSDYDPNDMHGPMIGSHWWIWALTSDEGTKPPANYPSHLMEYLRIGQKHFMGPGHVEAEGFYPMESEYVSLKIQDEKRKKEKREKEREKKQDNESIESVIVQVSDWLGKIDDKLEQYFLNPDDIQNDLKEMIDCANIGAYRACLAMAGRVLEQVLNQMTSVHKLAIVNTAGVGHKIKALRDAEVYLDPSTKDIWNIINKQRVAGVHAKDAVPIPSEDETIMVIFAVKASLTRLISGPNETES